MLVVSSPQSLSDPVCDSFFPWCHACQALTSSLHYLHTIIWWGQSIKLLRHAEGNSGGAKLSHSLLSLTVELKDQLELDKSRLNWVSPLSQSRNAVRSSEWQITTITFADVSIWTEPLFYQWSWTLVLLLPGDWKTRIEVQTGPEAPLDWDHLTATDNSCLGGAVLQRGRGYTGGAGSPLWPLAEDDWNKVRKSRVTEWLLNQELFTLFSLLCLLTFTLSHVTLQRSIMAKARGQNSQKKLSNWVIYTRQTEQPRSG